MADEFAITWSIRRREPPLEFDPDYGLKDASPLFAAFRRFVASHIGEFEMRIADRTLDFDFEGDLSVVFDHLPRALHELTGDTAQPAWLFFFEQGTDLGLYLERRGDAIRITFLEGSHKTALSNAAYEVTARQFLHQWIDFIKAVLDAVAAFQPGIVADDSYREYRAAIQRTDDRSLT